jgi:hypothetical protein
VTAIWNNGVDIPKKKNSGKKGNLQSSIIPKEDNNRKEKFKIKRILEGMSTPPSLIQN